MNNWILRLLSVGTHKEVDVGKKNRIKLLNLCIYLFTFIFMPVGLIANLSTSEWPEVWLILAASIVIGMCFFLNANGFNQLAFGLLVSTSIIVSILSIYLIKTQSAAPYGALAAGTMSVFVFEKGVWKWFFAIIAFVTFLATNLYQLYYHTFDVSESVVITIMLGFVLLALLYAENEITNYRIQLQFKNEELKSKNKKIRRQTEEIIRISQEKHEQELLLKQRDLESVLMTTSTRQQMSENISQQLKNVLKRKDLEVGIKRVLGELSHQRVLEDRLKLTWENIREINAEFYDRLLKKYPDLTKSERELTTHLRLSLTNKEIAAIKQSTENSVNVAKARLRKKMGFASNKDLQEFLIKF